MPGSSKSTSSCSGNHSSAKKRKTLDAEAQDGTQHPSTLSTTKEKHEPKHNLLEARVPVDLELPTQRGWAGGELQKRERKQTSFYDPQKIAADAAAIGAVKGGEPGGAAGGGGRGAAAASAPRRHAHHLPGLVALVSAAQRLYGGGSGEAKPGGDAAGPRVGGGEGQGVQVGKRTSILGSDESTRDDEKVLRRSGEAFELLLSKGQGEALVGQNMLALVHNSSYLTGINQQLLVGVPRNARDALALAGKLPLALKAIAIGIPPHELIIDPANGGLIGKFDAVIRGAGGTGGAGGVGGAVREMAVDIKGSRFCREYLTVNMSRLRPKSCWDHLIVVVRSRDPTDWTDLHQLDDLFWLGHVSRAAFDLALTGHCGASIPDEVNATVTIGSRRQSWLGPHFQWVRFKDLTRSWWDTNILRDGTLPDAAGSRHRTQPAAAGVGGNRTTVDSLELY